MTDTEQQTEGYLWPGVSASSWSSAPCLWERGTQTEMERTALAACNLISAHISSDAVVICCIIKANIDRQQHQEFRTSIMCSVVNTIGATL